VRKHVSISYDNDDDEPGSKDAQFICTCDNEGSDTKNKPK